MNPCQSSSVTPINNGPSGLDGRSPIFTEDNQGDLLHVEGENEVYRLFKSGKMKLKTDCPRESKVNVFIKIFYSNFDGQVHIYTDPDETILYGYPNPLKCKVSLDETCKRKICITKRGPVYNKVQSFISLVANDENEALSWMEALTFKPVKFVETPILSPALLKRLNE